MVVIEPVPVEFEKREEIPAIKPTRNESPSATSSTDEVPLRNLCSDGGEALGYASDGYHTASETELDRDHDGLKEEKRDVPEAHSGESQAKPSAKGSEDEKRVEEQLIASNEEQIDEKVLSEANNVKLEGNMLFKDGLYEEALSKYNLALELVHDLPASAEMRSIFHANCAACFFKCGKFEETIKECSKALDLNPKYVKVLLRRGEAFEKLENFDQAIDDMTKILEVDPSNDQARRNVIRLKPMADAKRKKLQEEMIGKLKEVGNSFLTRFGVSLDNFKAVQDPNTGSYSISFQR